jgi:hypothetical protein
MGRLPQFGRTQRFLCRLPRQDREKSFEAAKPASSPLRGLAQHFIQQVQINWPDIGHAAVEIRAANAVTAQLANHRRYIVEADQSWPQDFITHDSAPRCNDAALGSTWLMTG